MAIKTCHLLVQANWEADRAQSIPRSFFANVKKLKGLERPSSTEIDGHLSKSLLVILYEDNHQLSALSNVLTIPN
jgi:hypothetical protein